MKYGAKGIEFETLDGGNFNISLTVTRLDDQFDTKTVSVKASEIQGIDFISVVGLFRAKINGAFGQ